MELQQTETATFGVKELTIRAETDKAGWEQIHRQILLCKHAAKKWLKTSRFFASSKWGDDYAATFELQAEMDLGIEMKEKPQINGEGKGKGIITIQGISSQFMLWDRSVSSEMDNWDIEQLKKAHELLDPIAKRAEKIRFMIAAKA